MRFSTHAHTASALTAIVLAALPVPVPAVAPPRPVGATGPKANLATGRAATPAMDTPREPPGLRPAFPQLGRVPPRVPEATWAPVRAATLAMDTRWELRGHWTPEGYGTLVASTRPQPEGTRVFEVHEPGRCAVWWRPLDQPLSIASFPLVRFRLSTNGLSPDSQGYLVSLLLGNTKEGTSKVRGILAPDDVMEAKPWQAHTVDLRSLGQFDTVLGVRVECWAGPGIEAPATLALAPLAFLAAGKPVARDEQPAPSPLQVLVHDPQGNPVPACKVVLDYENLNTAVTAVTNSKGQAELLPRIACASRTASIRADGFLTLELTGLDPERVNKVTLVPARTLRGTLSAGGQPMRGVLHLEAKLPRPVVGRSARHVFASADEHGAWQATVPAHASAWLVNASAVGCEAVAAEIEEDDVLDLWLAGLNLRRIQGKGGRQAPTAEWLMREGDTDAITMIAGDIGELEHRRATAMDALVAVVREDPASACYHMLDLAWVASASGNSPHADGAAKCLLSALRRSGVRPAQAMEHLRRLSGGTLPVPLRGRLASQIEAWGKVVGQMTNDRQSILSKKGLPSRRDLGASSISLPSLRSRHHAGTTPGNSPAAPPRALRRGAIDLSMPKRGALLPSSPSRVHAPSRSLVLGGSDRLGQKAKRSPAIPLAPKRTTTGRTDLILAKADIPAVELPPRQVMSAPAALAPGAANRAHSTMQLELTSSAGSRDAAVETALLRTNWEGIADQVESGRRGQARADALALLGRLTTQDAILAYLPLLALTDSDLANANRNAASVCVGAVAKTRPAVAANAYAAAMLHSYRCGDVEYVQQLDAEYRQQFPDDKPSPGVRLALSLCDIKQGENGRARSRLGTIVKDCPDSDEAPRAMLLIGWIELYQQDHAAARAVLERLIRSHPDNPCAAKAKGILQQLPRSAK